MQRYIVWRLLWALPTLLIVSMGIFSMVRVIPGDAITAQFTSQGNISEADIAKARAELGIDRPIVTQYFDWLGGAIQGDFGNSLVSRTSTTDRIVQSLPVSLELALFGIFFSIVLSIPSGIIAGIKAGTPIDYILRIVALLGLAIPGFWLGILLLVLPSIWFGYLPPLQHVPFTEDPIRNIQQLILPGFAIGFVSAAVLMRIMRSSILEVIGMAGTGRLLVQAINQRDYPLIQAMVMMVAVVVLVVNLLVDISYAWLDPRIRYGGK